MKKKRLVPFKNYVLAALMFFGVIFLVVYSFMWYNVKNETRLLESYLIKSNTTSLVLNELEDMDIIFEEAPTDFFLFISYRKNQETFNLEKGLKPLIDKYNLNHNFYYFDVTDLKEETNFLKNLNEKLEINIKNIPALIYFKNNEVVEILESKDNSTFNKSDFNNLLKLYNFELLK